MDPVTIAKVWMVVKPFKRMKQARLRRKARKKAEKDGRKYIEPVVTDQEAEAEVKEVIARKAKGAVKSSTMGLAGLIIALGAWAQANPELLSAIVPEGYSGVAISAIGLAVGLARLRTAGR